MYNKRFIVLHKSRTKVYNVLSNLSVIEVKRYKTFTSFYWQEMLRYSAAICRFEHGMKRYILLFQTTLREAEQYVSCMVGISE